MRGPLGKGQKLARSALKASSREAITSWAGFKTSPGARSARRPETAKDGTAREAPALPAAHTHTHTHTQRLSGSSRESGRGPSGARLLRPLPRLLGYRAVATPLRRLFRPARGVFRRLGPGHEANGGARHLPWAGAAADRVRTPLAPRPAEEPRHGPGAPREDRDHARPRRRDALLRRAPDRARQARRRGPAGHAPGRLLADGEGPGAQALQGASAPLRAPPGRLHADGAGPQGRQPGPGREGGDRVQGQSAAAAAAAPPGRREDTGQPAAEGLPGGAGHGGVMEDCLKK